MTHLWICVVHAKKMGPIYSLHCFYNFINKYLSECKLSNISHILHIKLLQNFTMLFFTKYSASSVPLEMQHFFFLGCSIKNEMFPKIETLLSLH